MADDKPWAELGNALLDAVKESIPELVDINGVVEFAKEKSMVFAEEKFLSLTADSEEERAEHERNLVHIVSQVKGQAQEAAIREDFKVKEKVGRTLEAVGRTLLKILPSLFGLKLP